MLRDKLKKFLRNKQTQVAVETTILDEIVSRLEALEAIVSKIDLPEKTSKQAKVDNNVLQVDSTIQKGQSKLEQATAKKVISIDKRLSKIEKVFGSYGES